MSPQSFEKDDDTNAHIDFITAASVSDLVFQAGATFPFPMCEEGCYLLSHSPCAVVKLLLKCCKSWLGWRVV